MSSKKSGSVYYNKGGFGSKWVQKYLVISVTSDDKPSSPSRELSVYDDKASFYAKQKPFIAKSLIKSCDVNKSSHENNKKSGFRIVTKKKKLDFSVNNDQSRKEWINFATGRTQTMRGVIPSLFDEEKFKKDLEDYLRQSGLPEAEQEKIVNPLK